ncbi:MAG: phosphodiester glycosidase family protein [Bacteroidota bacterium]|uniref:Phosphodiester glycosidase family protein n=1 Tax=Pedobacter cryotolerans TaxID=2571270 RepID=A0A4U1CDU3_9SPHI|nr:phosphodiester glycosidase family protein [Pedobacter cryotolerans]TKC03030.1 phosphodiester glycosidase family protein [Pedobacter cryotolerans]
MLKRILFLSLLAFSGNVNAQNIDSVTVVTAKWQKQKIAAKTKLITYHFNEKNLFAVNQHIAYIEVNRKGNAPFFALGADEKVLKTTETFGKELNAVAAINGTFFDIKNGGSVDYIKVNGNVVNENKLDKNGNRARHQQAAVVIENGKLNIKKWDGSKNWEQNLTEKDVMNSGPLLIYNQQVEELDTTAFTKLRHPRSAVGIKADGKVILLTVDGRQENSAGMSLPELTKLMKWLGCVSAINLDGGGSTTLWVSSAPENGVVNYPSDNKKWDHQGTRKVANVILLKKKQ